MSTAELGSSNRSFAVLKNKGFRAFIFLSAMAMLADNVEHVISYFAAFQKFHSATLGGFAVIAHWAPYLMLSIPVGILADRTDTRRLMQVGMVIFIGVSVSWGVLLTSNSLQIWHAEVLLVLHGVAGVLWIPVTQLLIYDIVVLDQLPSAVRLNATVRYLGPLLGPALGSLLMLFFGAANGMFVNAFLYLPLFFWLAKAPYGSAYRKTPAPRPGVRGWADIHEALIAVKESPTLLAMMLMSGSAAFLIGNAYQAQMPRFASDFGQMSVGMTYAILLAADACGGLVGGIALESSNRLRTRPEAALALAMGWCVCLAVFALTHWYLLAVVTLFMAGFLELSFNSMAQALIQLRAPSEIRGRIIGVYSMASLGARTFSGVSVGLFGGIVGVHYSLCLSAIVLFSFLAVVRSKMAVQNHYLV